MNTRPKVRETKRNLGSCMGPPLVMVMAFDPWHEYLGVRNLTGKSISRIMTRNRLLELFTS